MFMRVNSNCARFVVWSPPTVFVLSPIRSLGGWGRLASEANRSACFSVEETTYLGELFNLFAISRSSLSLFFTLGQ